MHPAPGAFLLVLSIPALGGKTVSFPSVYGEKDVTLQGTYWEVEGAGYAALICPGYSCDRQKWVPMADLLVKNGITTMSFDYSGQGASTGTIGFDNAKTDAIPLEISHAIEKLKALSGLDEEHIILVGHSMGGRSILRLLYDYNSPDAETQAQKQNIGNVILMAPEVNYQFNAQASLFAGTSDAVQEPWKSYDPACITGTNVYLFGSTADDIVSDEDVLAIYNRIGGHGPESGLWEGAEVNSVGSRITAMVTSGVLHSYEMYSPKFAAMVNSALEEITGDAARFPSWMFSFVYLGWFLGLAGLFLTLYALNRKAKWVARDEVPRLLDPKKFLLRKTLMWLPGTLMALLVCTFCVCMPFGSPVMNTPYMCFIAGYGIVMALSYRKGKFKGTSGKLPKLSWKAKWDWATAAIALGLCLYLWLALRATMYRLVPLNFRMFWLAFATLVMTVGYYVSGCETDMLERAGASRKVRLAYNLIQYVPLFLLVAFYLVLRSYSGLIGQVQNMVLMYIFCIPLGSFVKKRTGSRLVGAVLTAFLFQTLMITSAALISMF